MKQSFTLKNLSENIRKFLKIQKESICPAAILPAESGNCLQSSAGCNTAVRNYLHPKLEVLRLTCPGREPNPRASSVGGEYSRKEPFEQLFKSYSEHLHMSARQWRIHRAESAHRVMLPTYYRYYTDSGTLIIQMNVCGTDITFL